MLSLQNEDSANKETRTAAIVAKKVGVSRSSVERNAKFAKKVDTLTEIVSPEIVAGYR